jgi:hypothetical protein
MDKETKQRLYDELNYILSLMEDREIRQARLELNTLINKVFYDQV